MKVCELKNIIIYLLRKKQLKIVQLLFEFILLFIWLYLYIIINLLKTIDTER